jgi:hypothetical protein
MTSSPPRWLLTRNLRQKMGQRRLFGKLDDARAEFPELEGRMIKVGVSRYAEGKAQKDRMVPNGERACDVFTLARSIKFCDSKPYYLKVPRAFLAEDRRIMPGMQMVMHMVAKESVQRRKDGERNYIRWFERELASYAEALRE